MYGETVLMEDMELKQMTIGGRERYVPMDLGEGDPDFDVTDLLIEAFYCKHDAYIGYGRDPTQHCPWCKKEST